MDFIRNLLGLFLVLAFVGTPPAQGASTAPVTARYIKAVLNEGSSYQVHCDASGPNATATVLAGSTTGPTGDERGSAFGYSQSGSRSVFARARAGQIDRTLTIQDEGDQRASQGRTGYSDPSIEEDNTVLRFAYASWGDSYSCRVWVDGVEQTSTELPPNSIRYVDPEDFTDSTAGLLLQAPQTNVQIAQSYRESISGFLMAFYPCAPYCTTDAPDGSHRGDMIAESTSGIWSWNVLAGITSDHSILWLVTLPS